MRLYQDIEINGILIRIWELRIIEMRNFYCFAKDLKSLKDEESYVANYFKNAIESENALIKGIKFSEDDFIKIFSEFKRVNASVFLEKEEEKNNDNLTAEELRVKSFDDFNIRLKDYQESYQSYSDIAIDLAMAGFNVGDIGVSAYPQIADFVKRNNKNG